MNSDGTLMAPAEHREPHRGEDEDGPICNLISAAEAGSLWGLFCERVRRSPNAVAYREYSSFHEGWRDYSWTTIYDRVNAYRNAFARAHLDPGDRIAILLPNGIDWVCLDLAAHAAGLIVAGLYPNENAAGNAYLLAHSGARVLAVDKASRWQTLSTCDAEVAAVDHVWISEADIPFPATWPSSTRELKNVRADSPGIIPPQEGPGNVATLIYTSGTMGPPKGVMLSDSALLWNAEASTQMIPPRADDVFLSVLPLAHSFERTLGYYLPMMSGCTVVFARSARHLSEDLTVVRPTVMLGVPLLYERMYRAIRANAGSGAIRRYLLSAAEWIGWRSFQATQRNVEPDLLTRLLRPILTRSVVRPLLQRFGGRIRVAVCGGAPLDKTTARRLVGLGLPLIEGYGLTEAGPAVASNTLRDNVLGSVGRPLEGVQIRLTAEGELQVRSPSVMNGYWKDEEETSRRLGASGWLSTGDLASIENGRLFIRGRANQIIVLSSGEKIDPEFVEAEIRRDPLFAQVLVSGHGRPHIVAIAVLDESRWKRFAEVNGLAGETLSGAAAKRHVLRRIDQLLGHFPHFARVRAVHLTLTPWTVDGGLITPTMKIKRDVLQQAFAKEIDDAYATVERPLGRGSN